MFPAKRHIFFLAVILSLLLEGGALSIAAVTEEDRIKALYLYNFLLFVDWPEDAIGEDNTLRVGVIGDDTLFELFKAISQKPNKGRKVAVEAYHAVEDLEWPCHVLFVGRSQERIARHILDRVGDRPVLTVSDMNGFTQMGGMVCFKHLACRKHTAQHPKRFEIHLSAVEHAGLKIRSRLLRLSDIVNRPCNLRF